MPPIILNFISAQSETGKTTVIEKLLPELKKRGLQVAAMKGNLKHYDLDIPGKDSWRFAQAGADLSGMTTIDSFFLFGSAADKSSIETAAQLMDGIDLLIVEGNKKSPYYKIEVVRSTVSREPLLPDKLIAVFTDLQDLELDIPLINLDNSSAQADFIYKYFFESKNVSSGELTHFNHSGRPQMVDVSDKEQTQRTAYARGEITMSSKTLERVKTGGGVAKGDVLAVAQTAAIMAVKETGRLIPMAHPLNITGVEVDFEMVEENDSEPAKIEIGVNVKLTGQTGVEMEALTGVSVAALTIYDMCKAIDKNMVIRNIHLAEKKGGRSGHFRHGHK